MVGVVVCLPTILVVPNVPIIHHQLVPIGTISKTYPASRPLLLQQRFGRKVSCNTPPSTAKIEELSTTTSVFQEEATNNPVSLYTEENEDTTKTTPNEVEEVTDLPEVTSELPQLNRLEEDSGIADEVGTTTESQLGWDEKNNEIHASIVGNINDSTEDLIDGEEDKNVEKVGEGEEEKVENQNDNDTKDIENTLKDNNTTDASNEVNLATEVNEMLESEPAKAPNYAQLDLPENILNSYSSAFFHRFANFPFVSFQQIPVSSSSTPSNGLPLIKSNRPLLRTAAFTAALHPLPIFKKTTTTTTVEQHHHPQHFIHLYDGAALNYAPAGGLVGRDGEV